MAKPVIFWLGATGYLGAEVLSLLNDYLPQPDSYHVIALVRVSSPERVAVLRKLYSDLDVVKGTLDDADLIQKTAEQADIVINSADSLHADSVKAILDGLTARSKANPSTAAPIYIHVSSVTLISDKCGGLHVEKPLEVSDKDLDVTKLPPDAVHADVEIPIAEAGRRKEHPIRTFVLNPGFIYGVGSGLQRTTLWLRDWIENAKNTGHSGLYGEGANAVSHVHLRDAASAVLVVLRAALDGRAQGGEDCNYFIGVSKTEQREWAKAIGDHLYSKKVVKEPGCRAWPEEVTGPKDTAWWAVYAGNQIVRSDRLYDLGWEPTETKKQSLVENLPEAIDAALDG